MLCVSINKGEVDNKYGTFATLREKSRDGSVFIADGDTTRGVDAASSSSTLDTVSTLTPRSSSSSTSSSSGTANDNMQEDDLEANRGRSAGRRSSSVPSFQLLEGGNRGTPLEPTEDSSTEVQEEKITRIDPLSFVLLMTPCCLPFLVTKFLIFQHNKPEVVERGIIRVRYLLPGRSLLRAGYTKETHPHPPYVCGFTTSAETSLGDVPRRRLVGGGVRTSIYYSTVASERGGLGGREGWSGWTQ